MPSTIILIDDPDKINEIPTFSKTESTKIFALNYKTHKALQSLNIKHEIGDDILSLKELEELDDYLYSLVFSWYNNEQIQDYVTYDSLNLIKLLEVEITQFLVPFLLGMKSSLKIINYEKPSMIIAITKFNDFLKDFCQRNNFKFNFVSTSKNEKLKLDNLNIKINFLGISLSLKVSRKKFHYFKNIFEKTILTIFRLNYTDYSQDSIVLFDFNVVDYQNIIDELSYHDKQIILFNTRKPAIWNLDSLKIVLKNKCKIVNSQKLSSIDKQKFEQDQKTFFSNLIPLWNQTKFFENMFILNDISFWESIKSSFTQVLETRFKESIMRIIILKSFLKESKPSKILEWSEASQEEREMIHVAKQSDAKIFFLQHAMMQISRGHTKFGKTLSHLAYALQSDFQLVWGIPAKNFCLDEKSNEHVVAIGSPRHDQFFNHKKTTKKPMILFAPTGTTSFSCEHSTTHKNIEFFNIVQETCKIASSIPSKKLIVKPHPSPTVSNEVISVAKSINENIATSFSSNVKELINDSELVITTNNSTIAVEAMMLGKPVISLQNENWSLEEDIVISRAVESITDISELKNSIEKILFDDEYRQKLLENSKVFLNKHFTNPGNASKKICDFLNK